MAITFSSAIWRPIIIGASIGALLLAGLIWLFVEASTSRQTDANWVDHTAQVLRLLRELEQQIDNGTNTEPLLATIQEQTVDNESQQRRLVQLRAGSIDSTTIRSTINAMQAEEYRLLSERVIKWRDNGRARDWFISVLIGLIGILIIVTLWLIFRVMRKRSQKIDVLALTTERVISALPDSEAYEDVKRTMAEVREALRSKRV